MLIIKLKKDLNDTRSYFLRLLLGKKDNILRDYAVVGNKPFDIYSMTNNDLTSTETQRLLHMNKGKILDSLNTEQNDFLKEYLFDKKPYFKRALLSSVNKFIKQTGEQLSVAIRDDSFFLCDEYVALAESVRTLTLATSETAKLNSFVEKVYYEYGLRAVVKQQLALSAYDLSLDFSKMEKYGSFNIIYRGDSLPIYPDNLYFEPDDDVLKLTEHGVPIKCACAVLRDNNYMA